MNTCFRKVSYTDDSYEAVEQRRWAATILDCPELLMMHAQARQDVSTPFPILLPFFSPSFPPLPPVLSSLLFLFFSPSFPLFPSYSFKP